MAYPVEQAQWPTAAKLLDYSLLQIFCLSVATLPFSSEYIGRVPSPLALLPIQPGFKYQRTDGRSFIHSGYFYSASSSLLLLRGASDTARILSEFHAEASQATASEELAQGPYVAATPLFGTGVTLCSFCSYLHNPGPCILGGWPLCVEWASFVTIAPQDSF